MGLSYIQKILQITSFPFQVAYLKKKGRDDMPLRLSSLYPKLFENTSGTSFDKHYVIHAGWAARKVKEINPKKHIDIASSLYFSSIVSAFVSVDFYDYRPAKLDLNNLNCMKGDLLNLPFKNDSLDSISCMHVIEHVGLGRYGDPIDANGDIKAINELIRVTKKGGSILFVVPIGKPKIAFNAHRIYSHEQVIKYFKGCILNEFSLIPDDDNDGMIVVKPSEALLSKQIYGCGCFWFIKK